MRGTSSRDYVDAEGMEGGFQNVLSVYGRDGEPCPRCKRPLVRTVLAQRGHLVVPELSALRAAETLGRLMDLTSGAYIG